MTKNKFVVVMLLALAMVLILAMVVGATGRSPNQGHPTTVNVVGWKDGNLQVDGMLEGEPVRMYCSYDESAPIRIGDIVMADFTVWSLVNISRCDVRNSDNMWGRQ